MNLLKNQDVKKYLVLLLIVQLLFGSFLLWQNRVNTERLNKAIMEEKIGTLGYVLMNNPELKDATILFLTEGATQEQIRIGLEESKRFGLDQGLSYEFNTMLLSHHRTNNILLLIFIFSLILITLIIMLLILGKTYRRIREFSQYAQSIVEGNFEAIKEEQEEGDFAKLTNQFNNMAKRLQGTLESLQEEKIYLKNVVSDISHQLKTPLSSIKMFNELLIDGEIQNINVSNDFLEKSQSQIERMEWLIINLLKMAKLETKAIEFDFNDEEINETINRALIPLSELGREKGIDIVLDFIDGIKIKHDGNWLSEAISNIVKNAIEQYSSEGKVFIYAAETPLSVKIIIKDEAGGIEEDELIHIFDRFFKGKNNKNPNSTGIGLALAKAIIENHNGTISVKNVDKGAMFTIILYKDESV